ncbi:MAG: hypothetical protein P8183_02945 [Anaerolineae bacterium]
MKKTVAATHYRSYILVCWREQNEEATWRFRLEDPHSGQRHGFANLSELIAFLQAKLSEPNNKSSGCQEAEYKNQ